MAVVKLYNKRPQQIQNSAGIRMPDAPENTLARAFGAIAQTTKNLADENFAMGKNLLINKTLSEAYNAFSDNPTEFNDSVQNGLKRGIEGLPEKWQKNILNSADQRVRSLQLKVAQNYQDKVDNEHSDLVIEGVNTYVEDGVIGIKANNEAMAYALVEQKADVLKEFAEANKQNYKNLNNYANAKDKNGNYIIGEASKRNALMSGEYEMKDAIIRQTEQLSYEGLVKFDDETWQDKNRIMNRMGISSDTYDQIDRKIKARRKALNEADKRQINDQMVYNAAAQASNFNPEVMKEIKASGILGKDYKKFEKAIKKANETPINPALITDTDRNFLDQFSMIRTLVESRNDGSAEYQKELLLQLADVQEAITEFSKENGTTQDIANIMGNALTQSVANEQFADVMRYSFDENTLLGNVIRQSDDKIRKYISENGSGPEQNINPTISSLIKGATNLFSKITPNILSQDDGNQIYNQSEEDRKKSAEYIFRDGSFILPKSVKQDINRRAAEGTLRMTEYLTMAQDPTATQDEVLYNINAAIQEREQTNRDLIMLSYSPWINDIQFARMEDELKKGKKPTFNFGGDIFEYKGLSDNDIIVRRVE